jgi:hypothetical protein
MAVQGPQQLPQADPPLHRYQQGLEPSDVKGLMSVAAQLAANMTAASPAAAAAVWSGCFPGALTKLSLINLDSVHGPVAMALLTCCREDRTRWALAAWRRRCRCQASFGQRRRAPRARRCWKRGAGSAAGRCRALRARIHPPTHRVRAQVPAVVLPRGPDGAAGAAGRRDGPRRAPGRLRQRVTGSASALRRLACTACTAACTAGAAFPLMVTGAQRRDAGSSLRIQHASPPL